MTIGIEAAIADKKELQDKIRTLIKDYEEAHGLRVVDIDHCRVEIGGGNLLHHRVELDVRL
jgi:hypothetical protein